MNSPSIKALPKLFQEYLKKFKELKEHSKQIISKQAKEHEERRISKQDLEICKALKLKSRLKKIIRGKQRDYNPLHSNK